MRLHQGQQVCECPRLSAVHHPDSVSSFVSRLASRASARQDGMRMQRQMEVRSCTVPSFESALAYTTDWGDDDRNRHVFALRRSHDISHRKDTAGHRQRYTPFLLTTVDDHMELCAKPLQAVSLATVDGCSKMSRTPRGNYPWIEKGTVGLAENQTLTSLTSRTSRWMLGATGYGIRHDVCGYRRVSCNISLMSAVLSKQTHTVLFHAGEIKDCPYRISAGHTVVTRCQTTRASGYQCCSNLEQSRSDRARGRFLSGDSWKLFASDPFRPGVSFNGT